MFFPISIANNYVKNAAAQVTHIVLIAVIYIQSVYRAGRKPITTAKRFNHLSHNTTNHAKR